MMALAVTFVFIVLLGGFGLMYQMFCLVSADAESRGLKHPKFWGFFSLGGNNGGGGLLLYLIGRRKYPSVMSEEMTKICDSRKKKAGMCLCFIAVGTIGLIFIALFGPF